MKICMLAMGSRGDVQPGVALSQRLAARGHEVRLAAPQTFAALAAGRGFEFAPLAIDVAAEVRSPEAEILFSGGGNLIEFIRWSAQATRKWLDALAPALFAATEGAELIVATGLTDMHGAVLAQARGAPCVRVFFAPMLAAADFTFATYERAPPEMPGFVKRGIWHAFEQAWWLAMRPVLQPQRERLGLPRAGLTPPGRAAIKRGETVLLAYSERLLPRSHEWPGNVEVTGWFFLDEGRGWTPPPALEAFLAAGPPPVYVGFGSMAFRDAQATLRTALAAVEAVGARAVFSAGWGGLRGANLPAHVFALDEAPHDWLFPRMAAIVHHGGAGTCAAAVRAGKPSVVTPFIVDQFPWARLLQASGVAPAPVPHRTLTAKALAAALSVALGDPQMRRKAAALGEEVRAEDGLARAVAAIERQPLRRATNGRFS